MSKTYITKNGTISINENSNIAAETTAKISNIKIVIDTKGKTNSTNTNSNDVLTITFTDDTDKKKKEMKFNIVKKSKKKNVNSTITNTSTPKTVRFGNLNTTAVAKSPTTNKSVAKSSTPNLSAIPGGFLSILGKNKNIMNRANTAATKAQRAAANVTKVMNKKSTQAEINTAVANASKTAVAASNAAAAAILTTNNLVNSAVASNNPEVINEVNTVVINTEKAARNATEAANIAANAANNASAAVTAKAQANAQANAAAKAQAQVDEEVPIDTSRFSGLKQIGGKIRNKK